MKTAQPIPIDGPALPLFISRRAWWRILLASVLSVHQVQAVVFTNDATIAVSDTNYDGQAIIVSACTLTVNGPHTFDSLLATNGATLSLGGGSSFAVTGALTVQSNSAVVCRGANTAGQVDGQWAGQGVTIAAGNVTVAAGASITADGQGYVGTGGSGLGPGGGIYNRWEHGGGGGGYGGAGGSGDNGSNPGGQTYGSVLQPTDLGSSGGRGFDGWTGSGGGAIRLAVTGTLDLEGSISANGAASGSACGPGSGGSIWVTTGVLKGQGVFQAKGADSSNGGAGGGGGGRIAVYYRDGSGYTNFAGVSVSGGSGWEHGGPGSAVLMDSSVTNNHLFVYSANVTFDASNNLHYAAVTLDAGAALSVGAFSTVLVDGDVEVKSNSTLTLCGGTVLTAGGKLTVSSNSVVISVGANNAGQVNGQWAGQGVTIAAGGVTVAAGASVTADGRGYEGTGGPAGNGPGAPTDAGEDAAGGSYGGRGVGPGAAPACGSAVAPLDLGSSGSGWSDGNGWTHGGNGGGAIRLVVSGTLALDGLITANGDPAVNHPGWGWGEHGGGGAGGSIWVETASLVGSGQFSANAGNGVYGGGGGGGGRIAIYFGNLDGFTGLASCTVAAGSGGGAPAQPGTLVIRAKTDVWSLMLGKQVLSRIEAPCNFQEWTFSAVPGQQVRLEQINSATPGMVFSLLGPKGWIGFNSLATQSELMDLPYAGTYVLQADNRGGPGTNVFTFRLQETTQTPLTIGTTYTGQLLGDGQAQLFRVDVPTNKSLRIGLNNSGSGNQNELYASLGRPPTRSDADYRYSAPGAANQQLLIPNAAAGSAWYVLVYADSVVSPGGYTLQVIASDVLLGSISPNRLGNTAPMEVILDGAGFDASNQVALVAGNGTSYSPATLQVQSPTRLFATFAPSSVPAGTYSVRVARPGGDSDLLANAFEALPGGEPRLETDVILPSALGYHVPTTIYVECRNVGEIAMPAPLLVLRATQNGREGAYLTLQQANQVPGFWTSAQPSGSGHSVQFLANGTTPGLLQPGETIRVPVYYSGWQQPWDFSYPPIWFHTVVVTADNTNMVGWASLKGGMRPSSISEGAWDIVWDNFISGTGHTWGDYVRTLGDNAKYVARLGQRVTDVDQLVAFEFLHANWASPARAAMVVRDATLKAPGLTLDFSRVFSTSISGRFDLGPFGRGWSHNWQYTAQQAADGTVTVSGPGSSRKLYQPDSRRPGNYFSQLGDNDTLTALGGGAFALRNPFGLVRLFRPDGNLDYVEDPNGNRITAGYSGAQLIRLTHSSGQFLAIAYNTASRVQSLTDSMGRQTLFSYDPMGEHLLSARYFDEREETYRYSLAAGPAQHALTEAARSCCTGSEYFLYDGQGRLAEVHRAGGAESLSYTYGTGQKVTVTDAEGSAGSLYFDHLGRVAKREDALGNARLYAFDIQNNLVRQTDPAGRSYTFQYDGRGNGTRREDPLGHVTSFNFTASFNRLAGIRDANGNATRYAYSGSGNLLSVTYPDGSLESWGYDALGNRNTWTNRRGRPMTYTHDAAGHLTSKVFVDGSRCDYAYNAHGKLTNYVDSTGGTAFEYNAQDRVARITYPGNKTLAFTYDAAGHRVSSVDQLGHLLTYHYNAMGRLAAISNGLAQAVVLYDYTPAGRLAGKTLGSGVITTYSYDAAGRTSSRTNFLTDGTVLSWSAYTYDSNGRPTTMDTKDGRWTCQYDGAGQLTRAVFASAATDIPSQDLAFVYDAAGNRTLTVENGITNHYTANSLDQYVRVGDRNFVFDADGNLVQEITPQGTNSYGYDDENRLVTVSQGAGTWQYVYDGLGNRVATVETAGSKHYVIDPFGLASVVAEYDGAGNLTAHYDHGMGLASRTDAAGAPSYYTFDALGSVQDLVTGAGVIADSYAYTPFGTPLRSQETIPNPFRFVGQLGVMQDGNGLSFMRARFYSPGLGRFASVDPVGMPGESGYLYANNNPAGSVDPSGLGDGQADNNQLENQFQVCEQISQYTHSIHESVLQNVGGGGGVTCGGGGANNNQLEHQLELCAQLNQYMHTIQMSVLQNSSGAAGGGCSPPPPPPPPPPDTNSCIVVARTHLHATKAGSSTSCSPGDVVGSTDPNLKRGPAGFGANGALAAGGVFAYRIVFENELSALAPAQQVTITDPLDPSLDLSTFELTEIAFADQLIVLAPGTRYFETNMPISYLGTNLEVQIEAGLRSGSGQAYAIFRSIDPTTSLPPPVNIGFLPPEDGTGRGQGHISYLVKAKPGLPTGTPIRNVARIVFDNQPAIATNQRDPHNAGAGTDPAKECLNTIDAGAPTSHMLPLPTQTATPQFLVAWMGQDDAGGSGVASYDIYVSDNGGAWTLWLGDAMDSSAMFAGRPGHTYAFYSVARDGAGNTEPTHAQADTSTTIAAAANSQPELAAISDYVIRVNQTLTFTNLATDPDLPGQTLSFSLDTAPTEANLDRRSGVFRWTPACAQGSSTNVITVRVSDDGTPPLSAVRTFTVAVLECVEASLGGTVVQAGQTSSVPIRLISTVQLTNMVFSVLHPPERFGNFALLVNTQQVSAPRVQNSAPGQEDVSFGLPEDRVLHGPTNVGQLCFTAMGGQSSAFVPLEIVDVEGRKPNGVLVANAYGQSGRVVVVGEQPLLEAFIATNGQLALILYAQPGTTNLLQRTTSLNAPAEWQPMGRTVTSNLIEIIQPILMPERTLFLRARKE